MYLYIHINIHIAYVYAKIEYKQIIESKIFKVFKWNNEWGDYKMVVLIFF